MTINVVTDIDQSFYLMTKDKLSGRLNKMGC